jgi:hypothetical protein
MIYAVVFTLLGIELIAAGVFLGGAGLLLCWPGGNFLLVAAAYAGLGPQVFGKRHDGRPAWWAVLLLLPYLGLAWLIWQVQRRLSREPCCNSAAPGLWFGRRLHPRPGEDPATLNLLNNGVAKVSDIETAEQRRTLRFELSTTFVCVDPVGGKVEQSRPKGGEKHRPAHAAQVSQHQGMAGLSRYCSRNWLRVSPSTHCILSTGYHRPTTRMPCSR